MPLKSGSSRKTVSGNIQELVDTYQSKGRIGTSTPKSKKAAVEQAVAISLKKAGVQKKATGGMAKAKTSGDAKSVRNVEASQAKKIRARGGNVTYKKDGKLPVGIY
jgi:hypothetical protein